MIRPAMFTAAIALAASAMSATPGASPSQSAKTVTWTGWFSDKGCATAKVKNSDIGPNGTACVKRCLREGAAPVFVSEQTRAMYDVKDRPTVIDDVGYHLEVTALVDEDAKWISVQSVKRLSEVVNTCALPKKKHKEPMHESNRGLPREKQEANHDMEIRLSRTICVPPVSRFGSVTMISSS